jgi:hypothetical protein
MEADDIGRVLNAAIGRMEQTALDISPSQKDDSKELVDGVVGLEAEIAESQSLFEIPVIDFAIPVPVVPLQRPLGRQGDPY